MIKLPQSVVEVDLVLCFSILHNLLSYNGNFYKPDKGNGKAKQIIDVEPNTIVSTTMFWEV